MPKAIQISRQSTVWVPHLQSYKLVVEAINPQDMPQEVFIQQRLRNFAQDSFDDNFVGVCTPVQLEDLPVNAPDAGGSFYRVSKIELVGRLPEAIDKIFDSLIYEVQKLVDDLNSLDYLNEAKIYDITAGSTEVIPGPTPSPSTSNKVRISGSGYLETLVINEWRPAAVTVYVNNFDSLPGAGNINLLYIAKDTNGIYRWDDSSNEYTEVSRSEGGGSVITSTDELSEGEINKYFTTERAQEAAPVQSVAGRTGEVVLTREDVGLNNVDNTSDADKPVSSATQAALDEKADSIYSAIDELIPGGRIVNPVRCDTKPYIGNSPNFGASLTVANRTLFLCPFVAKDKFSSTSFAFRTGSNTWPSNDLFMVGVYETGQDGLPSNLVFQQSHQLVQGTAISTVVDIPLATSVILNKGVYWLSFFNLTGSTVSLSGTGISNAALLNTILGSNASLTGSSPEALNTFVSIAQGSEMPNSLTDRPLQHSVNTASSTTLRFRVSAPALMLGYNLI
jgi:hypothetical protein